MQEMETEVTFSRSEIARVLSKLQIQCVRCPARSRCSPLESNCSVGGARRLLAGYLKDERRVLPDFDLGSLKDYTSAPESSSQRLQESFGVIAELCHRCMFHLEPCVMNLVYSMMEIALDRQPRKRLMDRPV